MTDSLITISLLHLTPVYIQDEERLSLYLIHQYFSVPTTYTYASLTVGSCTYRFCLSYIGLHQILVFSVLIFSYFVISFVFLFTSLLFQVLT